MSTGSELSDIAYIRACVEALDTLDAAPATKRPALEAARSRLQEMAVSDRCSGVRPQIEQLIADIDRQLRRPGGASRSGASNRP